MPSAGPSSWPSPDELELGRLVSERVSLRDAARAVERFVARAGMKVIIEPGGAAYGGWRGTPRVPIDVKRCV